MKPTDTDPYKWTHGNGNKGLSKKDRLKFACYIRISSMASNRIIYKVATSRYFITLREFQLN